MNILGFVFCILAVLALGASLFLEKQVSAHRLRSSYLGHIAANREILEERASEFYASLNGQLVQSQSFKTGSNELSDKGGKQLAAHYRSGESPPLTEEFFQSQPGLKKEEKKRNDTSQKKAPPPPSINPLCARLDLSLLVEKGSEEKALYDTSSKLLRIFYQDLLAKTSETKFLDALLKALRLQIGHQEFSGLEKVSFQDPHFQMIYYKMLKGMKDNVYPSLLDYMKIESPSSKICLKHAHPQLLSIFFTDKGAARLYEALHTPKAPPVTKETIERICQEVHAPSLSREIFDLFEIDKSHDVPKETTLIGEDAASHISLRKVVSIR
jgi:hypothetical protein